MTPNIFLQMVALLLIATSMHTWAEDKITPYKVEAMIVVYTDAAGLDTEKWSTVLDEEATEITDEEPTDSLLSNQDKLLTQLATTALEPTQFEQEQQLLIKLQQGMEESGIAATLSRDPLTPVLDLEETSMIPNERRFTQEPGMKMIWHKAWIEPIQEESGTISHEMSLLTEGNPEVRVEGNFSLHVSRYLHVTTDFTVSHWSSEIDGLNTGDNANSVDSDASSQITKQGINAPNWLSQTGMTGNRTEQEEQDEISETSILPTESVMQPIRVAHVELKRRMRSGELHYLDHPMLGLIISITPIELDEFISPNPEETTTPNNLEQNNLSEQARQTQQPEKVI